MAGNRVICTTNNVEYSQIRKAMTSGVRTVEELIESTGICNVCDGCKENVMPILASVCGCKKVSLEAVVNAVKGGADTVEKVGLETGAGTGEGCGKCKALIDNIIQLGR